MFGGKPHPMRGWGNFPKEHPFYDNPEPTTFSNSPQMGDDRLSNFRKAGYYASCFPEGDGICFSSLNGQSQDQIIHDICKHLEIELDVIVERN